MSDIDYEQFKKALMRLEARYAEWLECPNRSELQDADREAIKESCVKRFEYTFDSAWKHLKKYLEKQGVPNVGNSPKDVFRLCAENQLIENTADWLCYTDRRNDAEHDYEQTKADEILSVVSDFIKDAIDLYKATAHQKWNA